ncbi:recombinase family protein [Scytonema tolypothrichoides VB-61278]|nr:recombinase family protein [Scytonema tolypothrichoides VB-61278]
MTTAVGYVRVSSEEQAEEGFSLAAQERAIRLYCELHGLALIKVYIDDGYSGTNGERPALKRLLEDAQVGTFKTVIVHKFDRWARNTELLLHTIRRLTEKNIAFVSISEQVDCSTPAGKMMLTIIASTAQFHSDNLSVEVRKGILEKVQQGYWHGPYPVGYKKGPDGALIASEDASAVILAFQLYATGQYSFADVARELNARGHRIYNQQKQKRVLFDKWNVQAILKNQVYRGYVKYNGQLFPGKHAPLIDEATCQKVEAIMGRHAAKRGRVSLRSDSTGGGSLTELAYCEHCGSRMHYQPSTSQTSRRYGYYRCAGCDKMTCSARGVRSDKVEEQMRQIVGMMALPREWREEVISRAEQLLGDSSFHVSPERVALEQQLAVLENAQMCGLLVGAAYEEKRHDLEARLAALASEGRQLIT